MARPTYVVLQDPAQPEGMARATLHYRGPDPASAPGDALRAELWAALAGAPASGFGPAVAKQLSASVKGEPIMTGYLPEAASSRLTIGLSFKAAQAVSAAQMFKEAARGTELHAMKMKAAYFSSAEYEAARLAILARQDAALGDPERAASFLLGLWGSGGLAERLGAAVALAKTGSAELRAFVDTWFMNNLEILVLVLNPVDFAKQKKNFSSNGFEVIDGKNAFWWGRAEGFR
jgi:hypothetical protein